MGAGRRLADRGVLCACELVRLIGLSVALPGRRGSASLDSVFDAGRVGAAEPAGSGSRGGRWHGRDAQGGLRGEQPGLEGGAEEGAG